MKTKPKPNGNGQPCISLSTCDDLAASEDSYVTHLAGAEGWKVFCNWLHGGLSQWLQGNSLVYHCHGYEKFNSDAKEVRMQHIEYYFLASIRGFACPPASLTERQGPVSHFQVQVMKSTGLSLCSLVTKENYCLGSLGLQFMSCQ